MTTDTATEPAAEPVAAVLGSAPDLPEPTPGAGGGSHPAAAPASSPTLDRAGEAWDRARHENPPRLNRHGCWRKLRGNAARKLAGLPMVGALAGSTPRPPKAQESPAEAPAAPVPTGPPPVSASTPPPENLTSGATAGGAPPLVDGVPDMGTRPLEEYEATAAGWVDGSLGLAQMTLGPAWEPKGQERGILVRAVQRTLHHYQAPVLGPLLELGLVLIGFVAKRKDDQTTRSRLAALFGWMARKRQAAPLVDPYAPPVAATARPAVDPYATQSADVPPPGDSDRPRVAWGT